MKYIIRGGKRDGEIVEADFKDGNKLFKIEYSSVHDIAADGTVMISKVPTKPRLVFEAVISEKIEELK